MSQINFNVVHPASKEWTSDQPTNLLFPSPSFKHAAGATVFHNWLGEGKFLDAIRHTNNHKLKS